MMTATVTKSQLEAGLTCHACRHAMKPTPHYAVRCPKCGQLHQTDTRGQQ